MRQDISFATRDGTRLSGWLFLPEGEAGSWPCVVMTHGLTVQITNGLEPYAQDLCAAGIVVLVYDHRGWGRSGGTPKYETNPFQQMHDTRDAVTFVSSLPEVDPTRIGLWGTSYSGGTVLMVAAVDRRIGCVVSIGPLISGSAMAQRHVGEANLDAHRRAFDETRLQEMKSGAVQYRQHTSVKETIDWFGQVDPEGAWENRISVLSHDMMMEFEPGDYIERVSPTPLLMIVADRDTRCLTDLQLAAFHRAREPKKLVMIKGGHYEIYVNQIDVGIRASREWFLAHL